MIALSFFWTLIATLILIPLAAIFAVKIGYVDEPGGRKQHDHAIPPIGGLVIFPVYIAAMIFLGAPLSHFWPLFLGIIVLLVTGAYDEKKHLNAWVKFFIQLAVALLVVLSGAARIYQLGDLFGFGDAGLTFMSIPFSIAAVMLLINAVNLIDGLDGLAGGYSLNVVLWLVIASIFSGASDHIAALMPLMAALLGFLFYNMRSPLRARASVFMGDAGSLCLGLTLAWFCINLAHQGNRVLQPISVAWILALPIIDTCAQFYRRVWEGRHPFSPDRGHFHHLFVDAGFTPGKAVAMILCLCFLAGAVGYLSIILGVPQVILTVGWIGILLAHMELSRKPQIYTKWLAKLA
jgi:UDP-GlcNAc:undecaprenyl-phosphate GlcNAc-1-phosphate transferase